MKLLLFALMPLFAQTTDEKDVVAVVQKMFDGIAARDAAMIRASMLPDAQIFAVTDQAPPRASTAEELATRIAASKIALRERFTSPPHVLIHGRMAQVWGEYEFQRDGKFSHCGVDSAGLFKTAEGWKITTLTYTAETTGCK